MYKTDFFRVEIFKESDGKVRFFDLSQFIQSLSWKSSLSQAATVLTFDIQSKVSSGQKIDVSVGTKLKLSYGSAAIFKAVITNVSKNADGALAITASDYMFYLTKNMTTYIAEDISATTLVSDVLSAFKIPFKNLPGLNETIKQIYRDMTIWNIVQAVMKNEKNINGSSWHMRYAEDQVEFIELGSQRPKWYLDSQRLRLSGTSVKNMNGLYTSFVVRGKDDKVLRSDTDQELADKYGSMVYQVTDEEADQVKVSEMLSTLKKSMTRLEETFSLECLGNHLMMCGDRIHIDDKELDESGTYEVVNLSHSVVSGLFKSQIQLRRCHDEG